jgi:hypothetical protein
MCQVTTCIRHHRGADLCRPLPDDAAPAVNLDYVYPLRGIAISLDGSLRPA